MAKFGSVAGESLEELDIIESTVLAGLEPLLQDASIRFRNEGRDELSLQMLEAAVYAGLQTGWIDDNRARALVNFRWRDEAIAVWKGLVNHHS